MEITEDQAEVIQYIIGAILFKLKKRYTRQKKFNKLDELEGLVDSENVTNYRLLKVKSRGGLIHPTEDLLPLMNIGYQSFKGGLKVAAIYINEVLLLARVDESSLSSIDEEVLRDILNLFHKILRHHQCDLFLEKMKIKKKCTGKGKGLRAKLVDKKISMHVLAL